MLSIHTYIQVYAYIHIDMSIEYTSLHVNTYTHTHIHIMFLYNNLSHTLLCVHVHLNAAFDLPSPEPAYMSGIWECLCTHLNCTISGAILLMSTQCCCRRL
uniref:Uncharacterized protein n=1 Tax=Arundo donax TaxID=35708 RepID=A0A0A9D062_ARUDO